MYCFSGSLDASETESSIPKPEKQKRYLSRGTQRTLGNQKNQLCSIKTKILISLRSLRSLREDSVSAVCQMPVQNQNDIGEFMGQQ